ncbi:MAG: hypothetical protein R3D88_02825 [Alphaproteobacteria bacterium]
MARISQDDFSGKTDASEHKIIEIDASGKDSIQIPDAQFIANSDISRDSQDLILKHLMVINLSCKITLVQNNPPYLKHLMAPF